MRMTTIEFQSSKYFDNILVSTMKYLESFPEKTREEKSQFMKGLSRVLGQFPDRVLTRKVTNITDMPYALIHTDTELLDTSLTFGRT